jgi:hypothetical protein
VCPIYQDTVADNRGTVLLQHQARVRMSLRNMTARTIEDFSLFALQKLFLLFLLEWNAVGKCEVDKTQ